MCTIRTTGKDVIETGKLKYSLTFGGGHTSTQLLWTNIKKLKFLQSWFRSTENYNQIDCMITLLIRVT